MNQPEPPLPIGYMPFERSSKGSMVFIPLTYYYNMTIYPDEKGAEKALIDHIAFMRGKGNEWFQPSDCCVVELWQDRSGMVLIPSELTEKEIEKR